MSFLSYLWDLLQVWGSVFAAPIRNTEMLWVIVPVYLGWIITEIYQEKKMTSLGNAISNATIVLWAGIDWIRYLNRGLSAGSFAFTSDTLIKFLISIFVIAYGILIMVTGIKRMKITRYIGRIREVSYVLIMFTPILYGVIKLTWENLLAILLFFPVFYFIVEIIDRITPNPKVYEEDEKAENLGKGKEILSAPSLGSENETGIGSGKKQKPKQESGIDKEMKKLGL